MEHGTLQVHMENIRTKIPHMEQSTHWHNGIACLRNILLGQRVNIIKHFDI